jgi:small conductance mechanosensitive channel
MPENEGFSLTTVWNTISEALSKWGLKVVAAIVVLIIGLIIARAVRRSMGRRLGKTKLDNTLALFFAALTYYLLMTVVVIFVLGLFGIETTSLVAVIGAAGLAIGLALQGALSNFAAGVMLLVFRPLKVGDLVEAAGVIGVVAEIGMFSIKLDTPDNIRISMPNSKVYGEVIKNYTHHDKRRNDMVVGVSYSDDIGLAIKTIEKVIDADPRALKDPAPQVAVGELADSSVNILVRPWCKPADYFSLRFDLTRKFKEELEAAGCSIPFPQNDVHLHRVDVDSSTGQAA